MKNKLHFLFFFLSILFSSCKYYPSIYESRTTEISNQYEDNQEIEELISPYRDSLEVEINRVIGFFAQDMHKDVPEGELGNFLCDAAFIFYNSMFGGANVADFAVMNPGGIRVNVIEKGEITIGNMFELMPFENDLVWMELTGKEVKELGKKVAEAGGMPVSENVNIVIQNDEVKEFLIDGKAVEETKKYKVLMNDYMAQGGSDMDNLKGKPFTSVDIKVRDALISYCEWKYDNQEPITAPITGRIIIME